MLTHSRTGLPRALRRWAVAVMGMVLLGTASVGAGGDGEVTVPITNVRNGKGTVFVALYQRKNWLEPGRYMTAQKVKAHPGTVYATFRNLPRGSYGIAVFHDENTNNRVDTNLLGLPSEGYGFSLLTPRRKPKWEEVSVNAQPRAHAPTHMRY